MVERGQRVGDVALLGAERSASSDSGSLSTPSSAVGSPSPSPSRSTMDRCDGGGVGRGVPQQGSERRPHAGAGHDGVHGELAEADPELDLLERQAPVLGELWPRWPGTSSSVFDSGQGSGQGVLAEGTSGQVAGGGAELHAEQHGPEREGELAQEPTEAARRVVEVGQIRGRARHGGRGLLLRLHHELERGPVGREGAEGPLPRTDGVEGDAASRRSSARCRWRRPHGARPPGPAPRRRCGPEGRRCRPARRRWPRRGPRCGRHRTRCRHRRVPDPMTFKRSPRSPPIGLSGSPAPNMLTPTC